MKKRLTILTVLILLGMTGGVLYTTLANLDSAEEVQEYAATNPFPYEMPEVVMYPAPGNWMF